MYFFSDGNGNIFYRLNHTEPDLVDFVCFVGIEQNKVNIEPFIDINRASGFN